MSRIFINLSVSLSVGLSILVFGFSASGFDGKSAYRKPNVSYKLYEWQTQPLIKPYRSLGSLSVLDSAIPYDPKKLALATEWSSYEELQQNFEEVRDLRFMKSKSNANFLRRISWLYPENGCFARAAMAIKNFKNVWNVSLPNKVFVFGDLSVITDNDPKGEVTSWYHVAPIVQVKGEYFVLDPSIQAQKPIKLENWLAAMTSDVSSLSVAICESGAYSPDDSCGRISDGIEEEAMADQAVYLNYEWRNIVRLNRSPEQELGDAPPWRN